jgi:hypothetical protein
VTRRPTASTDFPEVLEKDFSERSYIDFFFPGVPSLYSIGMHVEGNMSLLSPEFRVEAWHRGSVPHSFEFLPDKLGLTAHASAFNQPSSTKTV